MFKVLELKLRSHSVLKNLDIKFINDGEENSGPYTSVLIGPNGSGKSYILKELINVFREIEQKTKGQSSRFSDGIFLVKYIIDSNEYVVTNGRLHFRDDLPSIKTNVAVNSESQSYDKLILPPNIIASSIMLNDRFPFFNSKKESFYQYSGIRRTAGTTSTKTPVRKTINAILENLDTRNFEKDINELTEFLEYKKGISFNYKPRYYNLFFIGNIYPEKLHSIYRRWVKQNEEGYTIWGAYQYNKIKDDERLIKRICNFLNHITKNNIIRIPPRSKLIQFDPVRDETFIENYDLIEQLSSLNIIESPSITINQSANTTNGFDIREASSGEFHFLLSFLSLFAKIKENSFILIDEPEISLHPNWQMKYIYFLKKIFKKYKSCHFIIATHSHFLVSDLKVETSSIIRMQKENGKIRADLLEANTYAWSAEDILYDIFRVKTVRNYYLEMDLRNLLGKISSNSEDYKEMNGILERLEALELKKEDPLNLIIQKARQYLNR